MLRALRMLSVAVLVGLVIAPQAARADFPSPSMYIGVFGGGSFRLRAWDLGNAQNGYPSGRASGDVGLRLGVHVLPQLALEAEVGYIPLSHKDETNHVLAYDLNILVHILKGNWTPVFEVGFGGYSNLSGSLGKDKFDPRGHIGLGVRGLVVPWMAIRLDVRDVISDGLDKGGANNLEVLAGLDFFVCRHKPAPKVLDRDKDGIPDADDACPDVPGPAATRGCPDKDGDGIVDSKDACPDVPGPAATQGCPDKDGDGIVDSKDACPDVPGPAATQGCPDKDKDGIADKDDRCPEQAGPKEFQGCPDRDKDGVPDIDDKCPDVPGLKEYQGCLPEKAKAFTGAIKGINFATGSAKVLSSSFKVLDAAVAVLKEFPTMRLRIEGHTDDVGADDFNQKLSQDRADSVRAYLVGKDIAEDRLEAVGYGETKPVQDNKTSAGRAANRRTEFTPLGMK